MSTRRRFITSPAAAQVQASAQIIGLVKNRLSGITLSRHAYADVLRSIYPDLLDSTVQEAPGRDCLVNVWAARPLSPLTLDQFGERKLKGLNIWCLVLESTALPARTHEAAQNADQIWVPTSFVADVCANNGLPKEKLRIVPYYLAGPPRPRILPTAHDPFTVLMSWDGRSSMNRKNVIGGIQAFKRAWPRDNKVRLRLKTRDLSPENTQILMNAIDRDARITLEDRFTETVDEIYDGAHVLLHCHRAEGYGRHMIEANLRRLPVIATGYSGCMDWLTEDNAFLLDYELVETRQQEYQYPQGGLWAEPDLDQAAAALRTCRAEFADLGPMLDHAESIARMHTTLANSGAAMMAALKGP